MKRRAFVGAGVSLAGAALLPAYTARANAFSRVRPGQPGWPVAAEWAKLGAAVGGRLAPVTMPDTGPDAKALLDNPFYLADQPGLSEWSGWLDAWRSSPSAYAVAAENTADVVAAVRFARAHNLRLVIKGCGHSFFGASNAPDSLLLWTRRMDNVKVHDTFTPAGSKAPPVPAVSCGAGAMWLHAYQAVSVGAGRYVQGGGCTTVGVAGLVQGGGFGSFSKGFGSAAASLIEAEVVTADGKVRIVSHVREPDLFWALKGGGGGTFGVVTRLNLATHELPQNFGAVSVALHAHSDDAFRRLLAHFIDLYAANLFNPHWGEQVTALPDNRLKVSMVFQGLTEDQARAAWKSLLDFVSANSADYEGQDSFTVTAIPARSFWNADVMRRAPGAIVSDSRPGAAPTDFWWTGDGETTGGFWNAFASAWMPAKLLATQNQAGLVDAWFAASRLWSVAFHFNKGLAGAPETAIAASRETSTNPDMLEAFALAIIARAGEPAFPGMPEPNLVLARFLSGRVQASMKALRVAAPDTGAYVNECDYFQNDWQRAFWGANYPRLARIKRRYDPDDLFTVHHGVGSEAWSADGFSRLP